MFCTYLLLSGSQIPERSGLPSGSLGAGAERFGLPSGVRGIFAGGTFAPCACRGTASRRTPLRKKATLIFIFNLPEISADYKLLVALKTLSNGDQYENSNN